MRRVARTLTNVTVVLPIALVGACGTDTKQPGAGKDASLSIGVTATAGALQAYVADEQGFFRAHGLTVKLKPMASLSQGPAVAGRQLDIVQSVQTVVISAAQRGIKMPAVAGGQVDSKTAQLAGVYVPRKSGITSFAQLAGKRLGTPAVSGSIHVLSLASVSRAGADPKTVKAVQIASPDLEKQLSTGRVDAVEASVPFTQLLESKGFANLGDPSRVLGDDTLATIWATSAAWASARASDLTAFRAALSDADRWIAAHEKDTVSVYARISGLDRATLAKSPVPTYRTAITQADMNGFVQVMRETKILLKSVPENDLIVAGS